MAMIIGGNNVETVLLPAIVAAGGGVIHVPAGTHTGYFALDASNVTFQGEGMFASTLQFTSGAAFLIDGGVSTWRNNARFVDLCLDGNNASALTALVRAPGYGNPTWVFERCWFKNFTIGFYGSHVTNCKFIDCVFSGPGNGSGLGINLLDGCSDIDIIGCTFNWIKRAVQVANSVNKPAANAQRIRFLRNRVRQDWWAIKPHANANAVGTGGTFTDTTLTKSSWNFLAINTTNSQHTVRVMHQLASGTTTDLGHTVLEDDNTSFSGLGIAYGDMIRTATAWTMVVGAIDDHNVEIDGWRAQSDYLPIAAPPLGTAYAIYRIYIGEAAGVSATQITTKRWRTLLGDTDFHLNEIADANTRFEVVANLSDGGIAILSDARDCVISENVFHGGWADQITLHGTRHIVTDNIAVWGQDMGMNVRADGTVINGGQYSHNGAAGIVQSTGADVVFSGVTCIDNFCANDESSFGCDLQIEGNRTVVQGCTIRQDQAPRDRFGIYVLAGATSVRLLDNNINGHYRQIGAQDSVVNLTVRQLHDISGPPISAFYPNGPVEI